MSERGSTHRRPAAVATLVLLAGVAASLAGNLQAINLENAEPGIGAYVSAVIWPLWLFGTVEVLLHTPWLANWRDRLTKGAAVLLVASVAAWVSYWHLANVLSHYGYDVASRYAGPLAIDAAMVLATLALNRVGHARRLAGSGQDVARAGRWVNPGQVASVASEEELANLVVTGQRGQAVWPEDTVWPDDGHGHEAADCADTVGHAGQELASDLASTYATVSDEASQYLASLDKPVEPLPQRKRSAPARYDRAAALRMIDAELATQAEGPDIDARVAQAFGVSPRTARRLRAQVSGEPVSGPPDAAEDDPS
jgi:hypothetical protein